LTIFNPTTGETNEKDRLLSLLMEWTTEPRLIAAMIKRGLADFMGISQLAAMIRRTVDGQDAEGDLAVQPMSERQMACAIKAFIDDSETRNVIARYVSKSRGIKYDQAKADLYELRVHLTTTYKINRDEVPRLVMDPVSAEATKVRAEIEQQYLNQEMVWTNPEPEWVNEYREPQEGDVDEAALTQWLRDRPIEVQNMARNFPPGSVVIGVHPMLCPAPGMAAFVKGYADGGVVVSPWLDDSAPQACCNADWLKVVAYRGKVTAEWVASVLDEVKA
jgi:hypothetical protein